MLRYVALLLLLIPSISFGQTITLPETIEVEKKFVIIEPKFDKPPKAVTFLVFGIKKPPEYASFGNAVLVALPDNDEVATVIVNAVFEGYVLKSKATNVVPKAGTTDSGSGGGSGATPPTVDKNIPPTATGLSVIMVVELNKEPADIKALSIGSNTVTKALASVQSKWYVRNSTDSLLDPWRNEINGKALPVLLVIGPGRKVLDAKTFQPTGNVEATARRIITTVANAIK